MGAVESIGWTREKAAGKCTSRRDCQRTMNLEQGKDGVALAHLY